MLRLRNIEKNFKYPPEIRAGRTALDLQLAADIVDPVACNNGYNVKQHRKVITVYESYLIFQNP
jgi:hypothetical protein